MKIRREIHIQDTCCPEAPEYRGHFEEKFSGTLISCERPYDDRGRRLFTSWVCVYETTFINCTPHAIDVAGTVIPPSGNVARVSSSHGVMDEFLTCDVEYGDITGLPEKKRGTFYIVSALVLAANKSRILHRDDLVAPATGHPGCVRDDKGMIVSVPGFVR